MWVWTLPVLWAAWLQLTGAKIVSTPSVFNQTAPHSCEYFSLECFRKNPKNSSNCSGVEECASSNHNCVATWEPAADDGETDVPTHRSGHDIHYLGCMDQNDDCHDGQRCHADQPRAGKIYYCCCRGHMCNAEFTFDLPRAPAAVNANASTTPVPTSAKKDPHDVLYAVVPAAVVLGVVLGALACVYRQRKAARSPAANDDFGDVPEANGAGDSALQVNRDIQLLEIKARGRFGAVWRGELRSGSESSKIVAVKIFPLQDKASWQAEQDIYNLPRMEHDNILKFLGAERRGESHNLQTEFWLTSEYHERGSLCDFLKSNVVSWEDLCKIGFSMAAGLTHLHEEIPKQGTKDMKPAIAHRDFKSKNVLIKADMTACVADFGLALIFEPGKSCGDTHGQVGTRRYMAPEVLEGAINFSRDAFLRIDMYACGLVLWEVASRCTVVGTLSADDAPPAAAAAANLSTHGTHPINPTDPEYKLPFEAEITTPGLEEMRVSHVCHLLVIHSKPFTSSFTIKMSGLALPSDSHIQTTVAQKELKSPKKINGHTVSGN